MEYDHLLENKNSKNESAKSVEDNFFETFTKLIDEKVELTKNGYVKLFKDTPNNYLNEYYQNYYLFNNIQNAFVYFIYNKYTKLSKIGCSNDPFSRLNQLNSMFKTNFGVDNALELFGIIYIPSGKMLEAEKAYHNKYSKYRKHGEWFDISRDIIVEECLVGDVIFNNIKIDYDTDNFLENEGFKNIKFKNVDDIYIYRFAVECIAEEILKGKVSDHDIFVIKNKLFEFVDDKFKLIRPKTLLEKMFRYVSISNSDNPTWDMYRWLYINRNKYQLTTIPKYDHNIEKSICKVIRLGNAEESIYYTDTLINKVNKYIEFDITSLLEVQANA